MEFSHLNLSKFRQFIKLCCKTFIKTGIIMTIENKKIRVAPDPFSISDQFDHSSFETKVMEIYKNFTFIEYPLISQKESSKNSTYNILELKIRQNNENNFNQNNHSLNGKITFRIAKEEFIELNNLLNNNFISSNELTIKAAKKPDLPKKEESKNYSNAYLSIYDKSKNSTKSGILFKPLKRSKDIYDYEDGEGVVNSDSQGIEVLSNVNLGNHLYSSQIKSKFLKKFCSMATNKFNKNIYIYTFIEKESGNIFNQNHLIFSYLNNEFCTGCYINNNSYMNDSNNSTYLQELKKIYKITINSEILIKLLKNFNNDQNNPDYISLWDKGLVLKTDYALENEIVQNENNANKEGIKNLFGKEQEEISDNEENDIKYIILKSLIYYQNNVEVIEYDENEDENNISKKEYVLSLIQDNIDDKHEELNKSFDLSFDGIKGKDISIDNNFFDDDEFMEEKNENDIYEDENKSEENNKKGKKQKNKKKKGNKKKYNE